MKQLGSVAVFCASSMPVDEAFIPQAQELGRTLAARGITLVYGGGSRGIMGALAEACHDAGGTVLGVLPEIFNTAKVLKKDVHSQLIITRDMHERKALMYEKADAFIILPGGIGTMAEIEALRSEGLRSVIVGKALYEGRITLKEIERCLQNG